MQKILSRSEYDFFTTASTRWRDSDTLGHINHTIYLSILETAHKDFLIHMYGCLLYTSPSPRDRQKSRMPSSA